MAKKNKGFLYDSKNASFDLNNPASYIFMGDWEISLSHLYAIFKIKFGTSANYWQKPFN